MPLHDVLTLKTIRALAGEKSFTRGLAYFHDGAVGLLRERKGVLAADVSGSYLYHVTLSESLDGGLDYDCTCPVGQDGDFCKHAVAVALSWLENHGEESFPPGESPKPRKKRKTQADTQAEYLDTLPEAQLKEWLMEAASRDRGLRDTLLMQARAAGSGRQGASGLAALRAAVLKAARQSGFLDWRQAGDFARRLYDAAELIQARVPLGEPGLPGVIEEVIREAVSSLENVDDSNGAVQEALHHLGAVHLAACLASRPDAVELAKRLFVTESESEWDFYPATIPHYLDVLGDEGLQHYRKLVLKAAESVPVKTRHGANASGYNRYTIERLLERLCTHDKNDTPLLHFLEKSLESPFDYLKLAERHLAGGRSQLALEWAERGLQKFPDLHDRRLTDFCIEQLRKHGQSARADELAWAQFSHNPGHEGWQHLLVMTPEPQREETSQRAIAHLDTSCSRKKTRRPRPRASHTGRSRRRARNWCASTFSSKTPARFGHWPRGTAWIPGYGQPWPNCAGKRIPKRPS